MTSHEEVSKFLEPSMRLAVTRSCVAFPRIDRTYLLIAVAEVFFSYSRGVDSFDVYSQHSAETMDKLVSEFAKELLCKKTEQVVQASTPRDRSVKAKLVAGLDPISAQNLLNRREAGEIPDNIRKLRDQSLMVRRNILAKVFTELCVQAAARCAEAERKASAQHIPG
jgi:hypothetical protein